ncbi:hypothetical protein TELCIR_14243, partial [Teladorsagia circumcincta]
EKDFKGKWLWRIVNDGQQIYGPNVISDVFPGLPEKIDAAVEIRGQIWIFSELYFMEGDMLYKMNTSDYRLPVARGYPVAISKYWPFCTKQNESTYVAAAQINAGSILFTPIL